MNKKISILVIFGLFFMPIFGLSAQVNNQDKISSLLNQITNLTKIVQQLQQQLILLQSGGIYNNFSFTKDLKIGDKDYEVMVLQKTLNREGFILAENGPGSVGNETDYFGKLTENAVKEFQTKYASEILVPQYKFIADGVVEKNTRKILNQLQNNDEEVKKTPIIYGISPESGRNGTEITINGSFFDKEENTIKTSVGNFTASSSDTSTMIFEIKVPFAGAYSSDLQKELGLDQDLLDLFGENEIPETIDLNIDFPVQISVKNQHGESNIKVFNVKF